MAGLTPEDILKFKELIDKQEITEVLLRYCRGVDRCDEALIRSAFFDDAVDDHGGFKMLAPEMARMVVTDNPKTMDFSVHRITNHLIEIDNDVAISEAVVSSVLRMKGESITQFSGSRYLDRFERREGEWRIAFRLIVHDWDGSLEMGPWRIPGLPPEAFVWGSRDTDPIMVASERLFRPVSLS